MKLGKAVVLLSGGVDSSVNLFQAHSNYEISLVLNIEYGQRAALREKESSYKLARYLGLPYEVLTLPFIKKFGRSALLSESPPPMGSGVNIDDGLMSKKTAQAVWVPNRNGIFLNIAAGFAESLGAQWVIPGFNKEEAATFPDNSSDFIKALDTSFYFSTANGVRIQCFTSELNKVEIVKLGEALKVPWHLTWPCYFSHEKWCGQCESCQRAQRAFQKNSLEISNLFEESILF